MTALNGRPISEAYVRRLGNSGKLTTVRIDERTKLYWRTDVERYMVTRRGTVRRAARAGRA
jgi:hypothetical protein